MSKCPADLTSDYDGEFSGQTLIIRRSKRNKTRIDYREFNEKGEKETKEGEKGEREEDEMVTE